MPIYDFGKTIKRNPNITDGQSLNIKYGVYRIRGNQITLRLRI
ncbi:hypothetical protein AGMMS50276_00110 [Synergistales bacterium]|nr:hypothetical protein AGMMS50276_00110 [Synergistales bacterium]